VRLSDVARAELGPEDYGFSARLNGHPAAGLAVQLAAGADAIKTAAAVRAKVEQLQGHALGLYGGLSGRQQHLRAHLDP
jgi:multidrug efflux pump subunit AcrB